MVELHLKIHGQFLFNPLQNFKPDVSASPTLSMAILLQVKQVDSTVEAGAQFQQVNPYNKTQVKSVKLGKSLDLSL